MTAAKSAVSLYQHFLHIKNEIDKHKWIESEKAGHDIGFDQALITWVKYHKKDWHSAHYCNKNEKIEYVGQFW